MTAHDNRYIGSEFPKRQAMILELRKKVQCQIYIKLSTRVMCRRQRIGNYLFPDINNQADKQRLHSIYKLGRRKLVRL